MEYQAEQERQEQKRINDVKAREAKSRAKYEVQPIPLPDSWTVRQLCPMHWT